MHSSWLRNSSSVWPREHCSGFLPMPNCLATRLYPSSCVGIQLVLGIQAADIEQVLDQAVQFNAGSWKDGVKYAKSRLGHIPLHKRRRDQQLSLLMCIFAKKRKKHHSPMFNAIMNQLTTTMTTTLQACWAPTTFRINSYNYRYKECKKNLNGNTGSL